MRCVSLTCMITCNSWRVFKVVWPACHFASLLHFQSKQINFVTLGFNWTCSGSVCFRKFRNNLSVKWILRTAHVFLTSEQSLCGDTFIYLTVHVGWGAVWTSYTSSKCDRYVISQTETSYREWRRIDHIPECKFKFSVYHSYVSIAFYSTNIDFVSSLVFKTANY